MSSKRNPPLLPPRRSSAQSSQLSYQEDPPSYDSATATSSAIPNLGMSTSDPRSSSQQSLVPSESNQQNQRRKLLLVFIHGFMGDETSFRSFPAHVHNLLTVLLVETHVVHTKIYPRYRSKRNISFARDDFSRWLEPHEDETTDVVLLGHSMGGLLCAEVAIMPPPVPQSRALKHRIIGTVNFDVPFLGMHPGIVKSGLASIFKSDEPPGDKYQEGGDDSATPGKSPARTDTLWGQQDPNFNPSFNNDVVLPMRKGWSNAWHFYKKHSGDIMKASKQLVTSHLEFGGAMANYSELKARYGRVRALEEEDPNIRKSVVSNNSTPQRVRFINYYTASHGKAKPPPTPERTSSEREQMPLALDHARQRSTGRSPSPSISVQEYSDHRLQPRKPNMPDSDNESLQTAAETLEIEDSNVDSSNPASRRESSTISPMSTLSRAETLPPVPDAPTAPAPLNVSFIQDAEVRKQVEKEHARAMKDYERALEDREKALRDRAKIEQKQAKRDSKATAKGVKAALKEHAKSEKRESKPDIPEAEMTHSQREELRLERERQRMEDEGRRMRGEKTSDQLVAEEKTAEEKEEEAHPEKTTAPVDDSEIISPDHAPEVLRIATPSPSPSAHSASRSPSPQPGPVQRASTTNTTDTAATTASAASFSSRNPFRSPSKSSHDPEKPPKDRKFCTLPPKDANGERDPTWVRVFMKDMDEVGAHCGLFFVDERYERLVGDVAERIEAWVRGGEDERMARELEGIDGGGYGGGGGNW